MGHSVIWSAERKTFRQVTEATTLMAWATDPSGHCFYLSPAWYGFTGARAEQISPEDWTSMIHADDQDRVKEGFINCNERRVAFGMSYRLRRPDRSYCLVWDVGLPKLDEKGFHGFFGTICVVDQQHPAPSSGRVNGDNLRGSLTRRERDVLTLISEGNTSESVARMLASPAAPSSTMWPMPRSSWAPPIASMPSPRPCAYRKSDARRQSRTICAPACTTHKSMLMCFA